MKMSLETCEEPRIQIIMEPEDYRAAAFNGHTLMLGLTIMQTMALSKLFLETLSRATDK